MKHWYFAQKFYLWGVGCNRGTPATVIQQFLTEVFNEANLSENSIAGLATTDLKEDEQGLLHVAKMMKTHITFYNKEQLNAVDSIENPSHVVQKHIGVKSVCEAAAILSANHGALIVPKKKNKDVTIAVTISK